MLDSVVRYATLSRLFLATIIVCAPIALYRQRNSKLAQTIGRPVASALFEQALIRTLPRNATEATVIVFRPLDCSQRIAVIDSLNRQVSNGGWVVGFVATGDEDNDGLKALLAEYDIGFPVHHIGSKTLGALLHKYNRRDTPFVISLTRRDGVLSTRLNLHMTEGAF